ncbi:Crp/Fnr family transcriptional regulator [Loktanella salsilacus]|uniref:Crp/Fnr family transcriptional regulator n=1 Tax=Loktanella salsilacus TaxID=195913 RepID=UPI00373642DD
MLESQKNTPLPQIGMMRQLSAPHWSQLEPGFTTLRHCAAGEVISERGQPLDHSLLLIDGIVGRRIQVGRKHGARHHLVALQVPGDFVDLHAYPLKVLDHDIIAITDVQMAAITHDRVKTIIDGDPEFTRQIWSLTLVDAAIHRHWALRNGTMRALQRVANLFAELIARMDAGGAAVDGRYHLNLSQPHIGDACGLSGVHINRVLRSLREANCCTYIKGELIVQDREALYAVAAFDPDYLYLPAS